MCVYASFGVRSAHLRKQLEDESVAKHCTESHHVYSVNLNNMHNILLHVYRDSGYTYAKYVLVYS